jgi:hypothetical protein
MIFYCSKLHLYKFNVSWAAAIKINFNFQPPSTYILSGFTKTSYLKSCSFFQDLSHTDFHVPALAGASFASTSQSLNVHHFGMVEDAGLKKKYVVEITHSGAISLLNFIKILLICSEVIRYTYIGIMVIS